jgi:hypothetical protein
MTTSNQRRGAPLGAPAVTPRPLPAYRDMFLLDDDELLAGPILDCPAGASPFGVQVRRLGGEVVSVDPVYAAPARLGERVRADLDRVVAWHRAYPDGIDWSYLGSPDEVHRSWSTAIDQFEADFSHDGVRYVAAALPVLPFPDGRFALAVSGFLLFTYPNVLDVDGHRDALLELVRVTRGEVRVFPLHDSAGDPSPHLPALRADLHARGVHTEIRVARGSYAPYEGSNRMLVCRS